MKDVTDWAQLNATTILVFCLPCLCICLFICFLFALWKTNLINSQARGSIGRRNGSSSSRGIWTSLTYVEKHNESLFLLGNEKGQEDLIIHFEVYMSRVYHFFWFSTNIILIDITISVNISVNWEYQYLY